MARKKKHDSGRKRGRGDNAAQGKEQIYEQFKLQWMVEHQHSLSELMRGLDDLRADGDGTESIQELFALWEQDCGFGSEIWPCFAEFLDCEYQRMQAEEAAAKEADPFANDAEGLCPLCDEVIEYVGRHEIDDEGGTIHWECPSCGATGDEGYNSTFDRHYNVCYANGKEVPGREKEAGVYAISAQEDESDDE